MGWELAFFCIMVVTLSYIFKRKYEKESLAKIKILESENEKALHAYTEKCIANARLRSLLLDSIKYIKIDSSCSDPDCIVCSGARKFCEHIRSEFGLKI
jgi:hypothetical protein